MSTVSTNYCLCHPAGVTTAFAGAARSPLPKLNTHAAFPSLVRLPSGRILCGWRDGPAHTGGTDGRLVAAHSDDLMRTWGPARIVADDPLLDLRECTLSLSPDGSRVWMSFFTYNTPTHMDCKGWLSTSTDDGETFGPPVRLAPELAIFCPSSPVIETPGGDLLLVGYGTEVYTGGTDTATLWSAYAVRSTDGGQTWGPAETIVSGPAHGQMFPEPWVVVDGGVIRVAVRHGMVDRIALVESTDDGRTWSAPRTVFPGTGRPQMTRLASGSLLLIYRGMGYPAPAVYRTSDDSGRTWGPPTVLDTAGSQMTYTATLEVCPGAVAVALGLEAGTVSTIYGLYLLYGQNVPGTSPLGDEVEGSQAAALSRSDLVRVFDRFHRPDGPLGLPEAGRPWTTSKAGLALIDGEAVASGPLGPIMAVTESGLIDADIEAEVRWDSNTGVGLIAHYATTTNYLLLNVEKNGTEVNLYKIRDGVTTLLAGSTTRTWNGHWHRLRLAIRRQQLVGFVDDLPVCVGTIFDADWARLGGSTFHGFRVGPNADGVVHRCRRFSIIGG
jgi:BNR repeat-like domain